jgi:predicted metalloprotease
MPPGYPPGPLPPHGYPPATPPWLRYPGHQHRLAPRRTSNTGALLATILVVVLLGAVTVVGLVAMSDGGGNSVADTGYDTSPSYTSSSETYTTTSDKTTTTTTTKTAKTTEDTEDTPTETTPAGPKPVYALEDNPLFSGDVGTPGVTCNLARWETNPAGAAAFFSSAIPCLDAAWQPVLEYQGLPFFTPNIVFPEGSDWSTPCGSVSTAGGAVAAFYCSGDNTIYMPFSGLQTDMYGARPGVYLALLAHEYGHHVQTLAGVMDTYWDHRYDAGVDTEGGLDLSRRFELQAQCFSGMFLAATYGRGSVDDNLLTEARTSQDRGDHNPGLPRDHGTDQHAIGWWEQGAQQNRTYQCNTWLAPPEDVA